MTSSFSTTVEVIYNEARATNQLRKLSAAKLRTFAIDLVIIGLGLRTGLLVDTFAPKDPIDAFSWLIRSLRQNPEVGHLFRHVFHLYESTGQSFLVNASVFRHRMVDITKGRDAQQEKTEITNAFPFFVLLLPGAADPEDSFDLMTTIPEPLLDVLHFLSDRVSVVDSIPSSISLPEGMPLSNAVPLAAVLLDYEVAYVPPDTPTPAVFLSGVTVNTYECLLDLLLPGSVHHTILKFSCPRALAISYPTQLGPDEIVKRLEAKFAERLAQIGDFAVSLRVVCGSITLDRLAL